MIETERNKRKTDRAWNTLYQRLDEEGLLSGRPASPFRSPAWKRGVAAAAVALLCLLISVTYLNTVSYTHLDVYKRQLHRQLVFYLV